MAWKSLPAAAAKAAIICLSTASLSNAAEATPPPWSRYGLRLLEHTSRYQAYKSISDTQYHVFPQWVGSARQSCRQLVLLAMRKP